MRNLDNESRKLPSICGCTIERILGTKSKVIVRLSIYQKEMTHVMTVTIYLLIRSTSQYISSGMHIENQNEMSQTNILNVTLYHSSWSIMKKSSSKWINIPNRSKISLQRSDHISWIIEGSNAPLIEKMSEV